MPIRAVFRRRTTATRALALTAALAVLAPGQAWACMSPAEASAIHVRVLQSDLMVAALLCDQKPRYNRFVQEFQPELIRHGQTLKAYFQRAHGKSGTRRLNSFITVLANEASQRSITLGGDYCPIATRLFDQVLATRDGELDSYSGRRIGKAAEEQLGCTITAAAEAAPE